VDNVEDRGPREATEHGGATHRQRERGQHEVQQVVEGGLGQRYEAARGQQAQAEGDTEDQHDAQPEVRDRDPDQADRQGRTIRDAAATAAAQQP